MDGLWGAILAGDDSAEALPQGRLSSIIGVQAGAEPPRRPRAGEAAQHDREAPRREQLPVIE